MKCGIDFQCSFCWWEITSRISPTRFANCFYRVSIIYFLVETCVCSRIGNEGRVSYTRGRGEFLATQQKIERGKKEKHTERKTERERERERERDGGECLVLRCDRQIGAFPDGARASPSVTGGEGIAEFVVSSLCSASVNTIDSRIVQAKGELKKREQPPDKIERNLFNDQPSRTIRLFKDQPRKYMNKILYI